MKTNIFKAYNFVFMTLTAGLVILFPIVLYIIYYKSDDILKDIIAYILGTLTILAMGLLSGLITKIQEKQ